MRLTEYLQRDGIVYLTKRKKSAAIGELVEHACSLHPELDCRTILQAVQEREGVVSSWVAPGIAIPHARLSSLPEFIVTIGVSREGIEYESADGGLVHLLILILGEDRRADQHILLLAEVARIFRSDTVPQAVLSAASPDEIFRILQHPRAPSSPTQPSACSAMNKIILAHALELATELKARALLLHADALPDLQILNSFQTDARILFGHPESGILDSLKIVDLAKELPSGLGARHAAAAGITTATRAMAVVVSQSTGRVSLFKGGKTILVLDRPS